jgi:hypothetical protein
MVGIVVGIEAIPTKEGGHMPAQERIKTEGKYR